MNTFSRPWFLYVERISFVISNVFFANNPSVPPTTTSNRNQKGIYMHTSVKICVYMNISHSEGYKHT